MGGGACVFACGCVFAHVSVCVRVSKNCQGGNAQIRCCSELLIYRRCLAAINNGHKYKASMGGSTGRTRKGSRGRPTRRGEGEGGGSEVSVLVL